MPKEPRPQGAYAQPNPATPDKGDYNDKRIFTDTSGGVSYDDVDAGELASFVQRVTRSGGCVIFGITSDGGAYSLTVIVGKTRWRDWPNTPERMLQAFSTIADQL